MNQKVPRVNVTFEDRIYKALEVWSNKEYRSIASLVVYLTAEQLLGRPPEIPQEIRELMLEPSEPQKPPNSAVSPRELELTRKWVSGERLENGELGIVANLLGVEPEDLVKKQRKFAPKRKEAIDAKNLD